MRRRKGENVEERERGRLEGGNKAEIRTAAALLRERGETKELLEKKEVRGETGRTSCLTRARAVGCVDEMKLFLIVCFLRS